MKKFTKVLLALLLALTMAFVFSACAGDDDDDGDGDGGDGGTPPSGPTSLSIKVDGVAQSVKVIAGNNGKIAYPTATSYTYTYGTVTNSNYGNAIVRFKVALGTANITDFEKVTFTWKAVSGDVADYKNLALLGTTIEDDITPYKDDAAINALLIDGNANFNGGPQVNGTAAQDIEIPIDTDKTDLTGDVWLSIFLNANDGVYTISNIELVKPTP